MQETRIIMNMPVIVEVIDPDVTQEILNAVFDYFHYIEEKFSIYKKSSEISAINRGEIKPSNYSADMQTVFRLAQKTKNLTQGYFEISRADGQIDLSGLVKGWAIWKASKILTQRGLQNFFVSVGGDIQVSGRNQRGELWRVGIQNPFKIEQESIKILALQNCGIATSGTYVRGSHIYNPKGILTNEIVSLTIIGPNVYEADRFATAAFAMGREGINFIENLKNFEGYMINKNGIATMTSGFENFVV